MTLEAALQTFIAESRELLMAMETALLHAEDNAVDADLINTIFRAAHTIKGSAGLFDLDEIVEFTHLTETVLDRVRSGEILLEKALIGAMLKAHDHMGALINAVAYNDEPTPAVREFGQSTATQLRKFLHREIMPATTSEPAVEKLSSFDDDTAHDNAVRNMDLLIVTKQSERDEDESHQRAIAELIRRSEKQQAELRHHALLQRWMWTILIGSLLLLLVSIFFIVRLQPYCRTTFYF